MRSHEQNVVYICLYIDQIRLNLPGADFV